jgi:hypothetical protein
LLIEEEIGVELSDDLLVPIVSEWQKVRDAMELTSFQNSVEVDIVLALHVVHMYPLHRDNWPSLPVEYRVVPILLKESPEMLVGAPFFGWVVALFLTERDYGPWIHLVVVDHFPIGVSYRGPHLQTLKLVRRVRSGSMKWGVLGSGVLMKVAGPCPLGKLLGISSGNLARVGGTALLTVLGASFMTLMCHDLQE